jgi:hypothetical protein
VNNWKDQIFQECWPYSLLLILLYNVETSTEERKIVETELSEEELILTSLKFTNLLEENNLKLISNNQALMYLMLVYFGKNSSFLDESVKSLIREKVERLRGTKFNFNVKLNKERSFESLYTIFLDFFQSSSYGDALFGMLVMIPLAQKYDSKWRKLVWSEYVMTMKFVTSQEDEVIFKFKKMIKIIVKFPKFTSCLTTLRNT